MSDPFEAAGLAALTGEHEGRAKGEVKSGVICANCAAPVTRDYCGACGQKDVDVRRPLLALIQESLGDLFAIDSRIARTAGRLAFEPGRVAREYVEGKRQSYVPPLRLYLFAIIALFAASWIAALTESGPKVCVGLCVESEDLEEARAELVAERDAAETPEERAAIDQAIALFDKVRPIYDGNVGVQIRTEESVDDLERLLRSADGRDAVVERISDAVRGAREKRMAEDGGGTVVDLRTDGDAAAEDAAVPPEDATAEPARSDDTAALSDVDQAGEPERPAPGVIEDSWADNWRLLVERVMDDYPLYLERMALWIPRIFVAMAFVFALMTPILYWRRYMAEHVVFSLYLHSGITAVIAAATLIGAIPHADLVWALAGLYVPYFIGASLRRFFGGRRWTTILRMVFAFVFYAFGLCVLIALAGVREAVRLSGVPWNALFPIGASA